MNQSVRWVDNGECTVHLEEQSRRLSFFKFLQRYPIFILAFGPPIFRPFDDTVDATKGILDVWSFLQVGLLSVIAFRATWRLATARSILIPKQIQSILIAAFSLGALYLVSAEYSPNRIVSAAYSILYFLTLISVFEFILDVYRNPQNWLQSLFHLRLIALLVLSLVVVVLFLNPKLVIGAVPGVGVRFGGGTVGAVQLICPMIAIISAYTFLYSLESRARSAFLFLVGLAGVVLGRSRGCELALLLAFAILVFLWARLDRRAVYVVISGFLIFILLSGILVASIGGESIWNYFNRGQDLKGIESASGRTDIWNFVIQYCLSHPWGMGYVAGFRILFRNYYALGLQIDVNGIGSAHNAYIQVLADAGWLALAIYLIMLVKIVRLALRYSKKQTYLKFAPDNNSRMAIECSLVMLVFILAVGLDTTGFAVPMKPDFYWLFIIIAIILGVSARMLAASRIRYFVSQSDVSGAG
jgi:O-antigen ligase